jgi:pheromone a factor receptor
MTAVAAIYRLRKYRSQFNRIISNSSSSSTLTASRFFRLFFMSVTIILFYAPVNIYFFYENVNITWFSYDWDIIHDPEHWNTIVYLPALGYRTFDRYCDIFMSFFVFVFFGLGGDAVDVYRKWMLKVGLGRVFPSLKHELKPNRSGSWTSKFSVISRAKSYFDKNQSTNSHTGLTSGLDNPSSSMARKPSFMTVEETSLSTYPSASAMRRHPTPILPDPYAISPMDPLEETATTSPLHQPHPSNPSYPFPATHVSTTKGNHNPQSWLDKVRHPFAKGNGSRSRHVQLGEGEGRDSFPPAPGQTLETHIWAGGEREPIGGVARKETSVAVDVEAGRGSL